jgi:hypothetical protein
VHFLVISKLPEFTPEGEVIPGQCEPYTGNWRLRLIHDGLEESVLEGTYYEVRRLQKRSINKSAEDTRKLAAEMFEEMKVESASGSSTDHDANESTQILGMDEVRRAMLEMELSAALDDLDGEAEWLSVTQQNGVAVASLGSGFQSVDADEAAAALQQAFESSEAAFVIDLGPAGAGFAEHLRRLAALARNGGRFLGFIGAGEDLAGQLGDDSSKDAPRLFADLECALAAVTEANEKEGDAQPSSDDTGKELQEDSQEESEKKPQEEPHVE